MSRYYTAGHHVAISPGAWPLHPRPNCETKAYCKSESTEVRAALGTFRLLAPEGIPPPKANPADIKRKLWRRVAAPKFDTALARLTFTHCRPKPGTYFSTASGDPAL